MKTRLLRIWTLILDLTMLVLLLAAPIPQSKPRPRPDGAQYANPALRGEFMTARPAYVRVEEPRTRR